ncbi:MULTISPECIES: helix-turn-helix domain-containing protein [unclassified Rhodanobacter]|uniref:helix-turn-helix domain-containing protein n=1 Tax=unclassified Rhodanobacter TaxID=2621553 RepID=UPI00191262BD|nr:helix-turn-helix domain-containing protein [Rhodanobacter sp. FW104-R8]
MPNPQWAKIHRSYNVEEAARLCGVHRNTVRQWIKQGLPVCDDRRPVLVLGHQLRVFLQAKRTRNKCPCGPGRIYCVRCRSPKVPAGQMADYIPLSSAGGSLTGICPDCGSMMYRRVSLTKLASIRGELDVMVPQAHSRIGESNHPFVNSDL